MKTKLIYLLSAGDRLLPSSYWRIGVKCFFWGFIFTVIEVLVGNEMAPQIEQKWVKLIQLVLLSMCKDSAQFYSWFPGSHQFPTDQHQAAADSPDR